MRNVQANVTGQVLTITIQLDAPTSISSSGKSLVIASTEGNVSVPGRPDIKLGLNLYTPANTGR